MVGCVIVHDGKIIGEGFTSPYGGPHAEVNAIKSVRDKALLKEATLYVTLEPCAHFGKTPPCTDLIIQHRIPHIIIGTIDAHEKVAGKGIQKLKEAECNVIVGVLEDACRKHHRRFLTFHQKKRPYILLKWAETKDGFIAPEKSQRTKNPEPHWISNTHSRRLVHQWRSEEQAILVGTHTVLEDNPKLNVREWKGNSPTRLILDRDLKIDTGFHMMDGSVKTLVLTEVENKTKYIEGIEYELVDFSKNVARQICEVLYRHKILSVLIEGGARTLQTFIDADLWDEARVFKGCITFGKGVQAPKLVGNPISSREIVTDTLNVFRND